MKFGTPMECHNVDDSEMSKSKPKVEFQYGGNLFSQTGSSNFSAVD